MAEEQGTDLSKDEYPRYTEKHRGYVVIHDISYEEAIELYRMMRGLDLDRPMYWWSSEDIAKIDSAAGFAILTHGFPKPEAPVRVSK